MIGWNSFKKNLNWALSMIQRTEKWLFFFNQFSTIHRCMEIGMKLRTALSLIINYFQSVTPCELNMVAKLFIAYAKRLNYRSCTLFASLWSYVEKSIVTESSWHFAHIRTKPFMHSIDSYSFVCVVCAYLEMFWRNNLSISLSAILFDTHIHPNIHEQRAYYICLWDYTRNCFRDECRITFGVYVMGLLFCEIAFMTLQVSEQKQQHT